MNASLVRECVRCMLLLLIKLCFDDETQNICVDRATRESADKSVSRSMNMDEVRVGIVQHFKSHTPRYTMRFLSILEIDLRQAQFDTNFHSNRYLNDDLLTAVAFTSSTTRRRDFYATKSEN